jgi:hypothetical protein
MTKEEIEAAIERQKAAEEKLRKNSLETFNELVEDLKLTDEEKKNFSTRTQPEIDASIQTLKILRGRKNQMKDVNKLFGEQKENANDSVLQFRPRDKSRPNLPVGGAIAHLPTGRVNEAQMFRDSYRPDTEGMKLTENCDVLRFNASFVDPYGRRHNGRRMS